MKKEGSLKSILAILVIILVCLVSFGGIYVKDKNIMKNILPDYTLGMDLDTNTILKLDVVKDEENSSEDTQEEIAEAEASTEVEDNSTEQAQTSSSEETSNEQEGQAENKYTLENYKKAKSVIEKRLNMAEIQQYTIRLDEQSGSIIIEVPNDVDTAKLRNAYQVGKVEIKINETGEVIGDNSSINKVQTSIDEKYADYFGSIVSFNIEFSSDAVKKFKEMKNNYVIPTDENGNQNENTIAIFIDGNNIFGNGGVKESEFLETAINGAEPLSIGSYTTDEKELEDGLEAANNRKLLMESEALPLEYNIVYANDVHSSINEFGVMSVFAVILAIMFVYLVFKYKSSGLLSELCILGFAAVLSLVLRLTKVQVSVATIVSIAGTLILQFIYLIKVLSNEKITAKVFTENTVDYTKMLIPAFIISLIIAFANIIEISGFGMVIFWGIIIFEIFNNIITRAILTNVKNK